jgi:outer membrane receptor protein involved in Fe transport
MAAAHLLACVSSLAIASQSPAQHAGETPVTPSSQAQPAVKRSPNAEQPGEIVVTGTRSDVIATTDRTSFSVANDLQIQNGTLADALRAVPGVEVDIEGRVSLRGDPGVTILVDGRPSAMLRGESRGDALTSMPAGQIDRVEVITNPSAAMSPEGSGGVINLVTKRVRPNTRFATVRASLGSRGSGNISVNGAMSGKKLTLSGDAGYRRFEGLANADLDRVRVNPTTGTTITTRQRSDIETVMSMRTARVTAEYNISPKSKLTGDLTYRGGNQDVARADYSVSQQPLAAFDRVSNVAMKLRSLDGRISWRRTLPGRGHELAVDLDIEQARQRRRIDGLTNFDTAPTNVERISNAVERTDIDSKLDYKRPIGKDGSLNLGYQGAFSTSRFDFRGHRGPSVDTLLRVPGLTNLFDFSQAVHAFYGTYQFDAGKFEAQIGLRAEQVELDIDQITDRISIERDYFRLYPTAHLGYELSGTEQLRASYSRRIQRPSAQDLNPYTIYLDPLNLRRGNPFLRPEVTNSFEASWQRRKGSTFYSITGFYRTSQGGVTDIVQDLGDGVFLNTRANLATGERVGVEVVANGRLTKKLTYNASGTFLWNEIDPRQGGVGAKRSGTTGTVRASLTWQPDTKDFFQLSGNLSGRQLIAQGFRSPGGVLNLGYRRKLDERFSLTLTGQNVLGTARQRTVIDTAVLRDRIRQSGFGPIVMLGLSWNLGSQSGRRRPEPAFEFDQGAAAPIG